MSAITVNEGKLCIIKLQEVTSVKEGLEEVRGALLDFTTKQEMEDNLQSFILVDLSAFNIINSNIIGVFGSIVMNPKVQLLALCGVQPPVKEILEKFGVIKNIHIDRQELAADLQQNLRKVVLFDTTQSALISLNPD